jgi:hypothetical protein
MRSCPADPNRDDWHVVLDQLCVFDFVGVSGAQSRFSPEATKSLRNIK